MNIRPYVAEFLATFLLALIVILSGTPSIASLGIPTAFLVAIALGLAVYTVGSVSGAHLNPAVTVALATIKKLSPQDAVSYILAQLLGAIVAMFVASFIAGQELAVTTPNTALVTIIEAIGAFILMWGIMSVVRGKTPEAASGLVIGGSLGFGVLIAAGLGSNGILNPAVALAVHSFNLANLVGPIIGTIAAAWLYSWLVPVPVAHHGHQHAA